MKKTIAILCLLALLISLFSCAPAPGGEMGGGESVTAESTVKEEYQAAVDKTLAQSALRYSFLLREEKTNRETEADIYRVKEGYDSFSYAQIRKDGGLWFYSDTAYSKDENGAFYAPMTVRAFREYLDRYYAPATPLDSSYISQAVKEGDSFSLTLNEEGLSLFDSVLISGFSPVSASVRAKVDGEGLIRETAYLFRGENGEDDQVTLTVRLLENTGSELSSLAGFSYPKKEEYTAVSSIEAPRMVATSIGELAKKENVSLTSIVSLGAKRGTVSFSDYRENVLVQKNKEEFYHSITLSYKNSLSSAYTFTQLLSQKDGALENEYDMNTGALIRQEEIGVAETPWPQLLMTALPAASELENLSVTEGTEGKTLTFTLTDAACLQSLRKNMNFFTAAGVTADEFTPTSSEGSLFISEEGFVMAGSFTFEGEVKTMTPQGEETTLVSFQYSLTVEKGEVTELPQLLVPERGDDSNNDHLHPVA